MADRRARFQRRVLAATLRHGRGTAVLAAAAVAIGASVAAALMHVSGDVGHKVAHELRALGPNLLLTPAGPGARAGVGAPAAATRGAAPGAGVAVSPGGNAGDYLDAADAGRRLGTVGLRGAALLYVVAEAGGEPLALIGADPDAVAALHPHWRVTRAGPGAIAGSRLLDRLKLAPGSSLRVTMPGGRPLDVAIGARLDAGGADDEALWLPLDMVQAGTGLTGRASVVQARVDGGREAAERVRVALERDGAVRASIVGALTAAEAELLERLRRIMTLVTAAALVAAGLCAFGALTDRALERRKDFALLKAMGADRSDILAPFAVEAAAIGLVGGVVGWGFGLLMAQIIGRQVFHAAIAVRPEVPLVVIGMALATALASSIGPARLALAVEPAAALKGD